MRVVLATVGVVFALGFLCIPLVGPPSPHAWWIAGSCAGFCLLISLAFLGGRVGKVARWSVGLLVGSIVLAALLAKFTELDSEPSVQGWDGPLAWIRVVVLAVVFAASAYVRNRRHRKSPPVEMPKSWWETMALDNEIDDVRRCGLVYARQREFEEGEDTQELLVRFLAEHELRSERVIDLETARGLAVRWLRWDLNDGNEVLDEVTARGFVNDFLETVTFDRPLVEIVVAQVPGCAGILVDAEGLGAELVVDDRPWESREP